jgi:hypothetical protein
MSLRIFLSSVALVLFGLAAPAPAAALPNCTRFLSDSASYSQRMDQLLSTEKAEELLKTLVDLRREGRIQKPSQLFDAFLFYRLRLLPVPVGEQVMRALNEGFRLHLDSSVNALLGGGAMLFESRESGHKSCQVFVCVPQALFGSALDFAVRVHEIEHVVQHFMGLSSKGPRQMFFAEQGAMRAEAVMLLSFSKEELSHLRTFVHHHLLTAETKAFSERALERVLQGGGVQDYVRSQWKAGRYSRGSILKEEIKRFFEGLFKERENP